MTGLKNILIATDFTQASDAAQEVAVHLSWVFGSKVSLLHVVEPVKGTPKIQSQLYHQMAIVMRDLAEDLRKKRVDVLTADTELGKPVSEILKKADELDPDLIIIGAGKQAKFTGFQVGPIAEAVLQRAEAPVLACRPGLPAPVFHKIVCPFDHSETSKHALQNAIRLAKAFKSKLIVVTVFAEGPTVDRPGNFDAFSDSLDAVQEAWQSEIDSYLKQVNFEGVSWHKEFLKGKPSEQITNACQSHGADVVVMGAKGDSSADNFLLGSVTARVLRQLPCSILAVKNRDLLDQAVEEEGRMIRMLFAEGYELYKASDFASALVKLRQVLARDPYHARALETAATIAESLGDDGRARRYRRRLEQLHGVLVDASVAS